MSIALASTIREASLSADMESDNDISSIMGESFNPSCDAEVCAHPLFSDALNKTVVHDPLALIAGTHH